MRILLVEDDRSLSRAVSTILQKNNYSVDCVNNGQLALDYLEQDIYDAVIMDIEGLDNGANDYLTKPFDTRELLARLRVLTRNERQHDSVMTLGNITLNTSTCELSSATDSFLLTNKEYQMMLMFMNNKDQVISAEHFMEKIWDSDSDSDISTVWSYISYLRRKLEALGSEYSIATRRNMGYYLKNNN